MDKGCTRIFSKSHKKDVICVRVSVLGFCLREISLTEIYFDLSEANRFMDNILLNSLFHSDGSYRKRQRKKKKSKFIRRRMNRMRIFVNKMITIRKSDLLVRMCVCIAVNFNYSVIDVFLKWFAFFRVFVVRSTFFQFSRSPYSNE